MSVRLDKFLSQSGERSRSEAVKAVRAGQVRVNGAPVRDPSLKINETDTVTLAGETVGDDAMQYYLFYKPSGVLTAARDSRAQTVMDLLPEALSRRKVLPVGRLDKDTTGLLLLTNDGVLAHSLLDPKRHVWKRYIATVEGKLDENDVKAFEEGIPLKDFTAKPARLEIDADDPGKVFVEIAEGKFHQVKRMCERAGKNVVYLKRVAIGDLQLDETLEPGKVRELSREELALFGW